MSIRSKMVHRAAVERDVGTSTDSLNQLSPDRQQINAALPCYVQTKMERIIADGNKFMALATYTMWAPLDADLKEEDVITRVVNRRGQEIFGNRLRVKPVVRRETHLEAVLEEYS